MSEQYVVVTRFLARRNGVAVARAYGPYTADIADRVRAEVLIRYPGLEVHVCPMVKTTPVSVAVA